MTPRVTTDVLRRFSAFRFCLCGLLAGAMAVAGCAPGVNNRSLGSSDDAPDAPRTEVVVVEAEPEPSPEQVRASEMREQKREIAQLRDQLDADRARAEASASRAEAEALQAQESVRLLQSELAEIRVRTDAATAQADKAFALATEFLSNLVEARDEQRAIVERNMANFDAFDERLSSVEGLVVENDQQRQSEVAQSNTRAADLEVKMQQADEDLAQMRTQLTDLYREGEEMRAALDSGPMLRMLRDLEATQRDTAVLRGLLEEMQSEQQAARKRLQDYYVDLDSRIQALQETQERERAAREEDARRREEEQFGPGSSVTSDPAEAMREPDGPADIIQSGDLGDDAGQLLESFEQELQRRDAQQAVETGADVAPVRQSDQVTPQAGEGAAAAPGTQEAVTEVPEIVSTRDSVPPAPAAAPGEARVETDADLSTDGEPEPVVSHGVLETDFSDAAGGGTGTDR